MKGLFPRFTQKDISAVKYDVNDLTHKICSGKLYGYEYGKVYEAMKFYYGEQGLAAPFVVGCENPLEMQYISNMMRILHKYQEPKFMSLYNQCLAIARSKNPDIKMLEMASQALFDYVLPVVVQLVEFYKKAKEHKLFLGRFSGALKSLFDDKQKEIMKEFDNMTSSSPALKYISSKLSKLDLYRALFTYTLNFLPTAGILSNYHYLVLGILNQYYRQTQLMRNFDEFKRHHEESRVMHALTFKEVVVVSKYPKRVHVDQNNRFHNTKGVAIEMGCSHPLLNLSLYFIHGRPVHRKELITEGFTLEDFIRCMDEEERAMMFEIVNERSPDAIIDFFQLVEIDRQTIEHDVKIPMYNSLGEFVGFKEAKEQETLILYHSRQEFEDVRDPMMVYSFRSKLAWIRFVCPSTGTNYMIYTSPSFKSAIEAAKYSRPFSIDIPYQWTQRS